jgi:hypothetical protein
MTNPADQRCLLGKSRRLTSKIRGPLAAAAQVGPALLDLSRFLAHWHTKFQIPEQRQQRLLGAGVLENLYGGCHITRLYFDDMKNDFWFRIAVIALGGLPIGLVIFAVYK